MSDNVDGAVEQTKTFSEEYVKELRAEAASYRVKAREVEQEFNEFKQGVSQQKQEQSVKDIEAIANELGMVDPSVSVTLLGDKIEQIANGELDTKEALTSLLDDKPYLKRGPVGRPSNPVENTSKSQMFTREQIAKMSPAEVNSNWDIIQEQLSNQNI